MHSANAVARFAIAGLALGAVAATALWLAVPTYGIAVFGPRGGAGGPMVVRGSVQGALGGLAVGLTLLLAAAIAGADRASLARRGLRLVVATAVCGALAGAAIGAGIGAGNPSYYRSEFGGSAFGRSALQAAGASAGPVEIGAGLGLTQGAFGGAIVGTLVMIGVAWGSRDPHAARDPRVRRRSILVLGGTLGVAAAVGAAAVGFARNDSGSLRTARAFAEALAALADNGDGPLPRNATRRHFGNGEWAAVTDRSSHSAPFSGGGTLVTRASDGTVRAFGGHVCGDGFGGSILTSADTLEDFYGLLADADFAEIARWRAGSGGPGRIEPTLTGEQLEDVRHASSLLRLGLLDHLAQHRRLPMSLDELFSGVERRDSLGLLGPSRWRSPEVPGIGPVVWTYEISGDAACTVSCEPRPGVRITARLAPDLAQWHWSDMEAAPTSAAPSRRAE
jgi:hypothetical protein